MGRQVGFVGRRQELGRLEAALARAAGGQPAVLLIGGEAGVGKTRLVAEFAERAGAAGVRVLVGGCVRLGEHALPFVPFSEALRGLVRSLDPPAVDALVGEGRAELARLVPDLGAPEPVAEPRDGGDWTQARLFALVLGLMERLSGMDHRRPGPVRSAGRAPPLPRPPGRDSLSHWPLTAAAAA